VILIDTNILSTFARINRLDFLSQVFNADVLYISANVYDEVRKGIEKGYSFLSPVFVLVESKKLRIATLSEKECLIEIPSSFGPGERDSIAICVNRNATFATNEKRVISYCKRNSIAYTTLNKILTASLRLGILRREELVRLIEEIEDKDNIVFACKEQILEDRE
jgi:predicted nucleic acid-binding protein